MATTVDPTARELEQRADIESLDELLATRRKIVGEIARLKALHGPFGKFDYKRKNLLSAKKVQARMAITERVKKEGGKLTEDMVDAEAHADPDYEKFIDNGIADHIEYIEKENELAEVEDRIKNRELELRAYTAEISLR